MLAFNIVKHYLCLLLLILLSLPAYAEIETFQVESARITKIGNGYILDAEIAYPLTARVVEAIDNGVPIVFLQQFELLQSIPLLGKYWQWQASLWSFEIRYELRYHALSQQYIVQDMSTLHQTSFPSLQDALHTIGKLNAFNLPPAHFAEKSNLLLQLRTELDLHALPTPMRPGALVSSKWQLASPWVTAKWQ